MTLYVLQFIELCIGWLSLIKRPEIWTTLTLNGNHGLTMNTGCPKLLPQQKNNNVSARLLNKTPKSIDLW